jgi:hypothetical protein
MRTRYYVAALTAALNCVVPAAAEDDVPATAAEVSETPSPDTSPAAAVGYRLCAACNTLNKPGAVYCMRCGAALPAAGTDEGERPGRVLALKKFAAAPLAAAGTFYYAGAGAFARLDWGRVAYEPAYYFVGPSKNEGDFYFYYQETTPHYMENLTRLYTATSATFRPFVAVDLRLRYESVYDDHIHYEPRRLQLYSVAPAAGGGVNVNYDDRASFLELAVALGPEWWWVSPGGRSVVNLGVALTFENLTYFSRRIGLLGRIAFIGAKLYSEFDRDSFILASVGPAFGW